MAFQVADDLLDFLGDEVETGKALGTDLPRGQRWREVEIYNEPTGKPRVLLHGGTGDLARGRHIDAVLLSLSHTAELAAATVVLESREADASTGERGTDEHHCDPPELRGALR